MENKKIIADIIAWIHGVWITLMLLSLPAVLLVPELRMYVLIFAILTAGSWVVTGGCPLRSWELRIRNKHHPDGVYQGTFIKHYVNKHLGTNFSDFALRLVIYPYTLLIILLAFMG